MLQHFKVLLPVSVAEFPVSRIVFFAGVVVWHLPASAWSDVLKAPSMACGGSASQSMHPSQTICTARAHAGLEHVEGYIPAEHVSEDCVQHIPLMKVFASTMKSACEAQVK